VKRGELNLKIGRANACPNCSLETLPRVRVSGQISLEKEAKEGESPVCDSFTCACRFVLRVELPGIAALNGWYISSKAKYGRETDSEQVLFDLNENAKSLEIKNETMDLASPINPRPLGERAG